MTVLIAVAGVLCLAGFVALWLPGGLLLAGVALLWLASVRARNKREVVRRGAA